MLTSRALDHYALQNPLPYYTFPNNAVLNGNKDDARLALATWNPSTERLDSYLRRGGSPNSCTTFGCPLVVGLTRAGEFEDVKLLLTHRELNAGKSEKNTFRTALMEIMDRFHDHDPGEMIELADTLIMSIANDTSRTCFVNLHDWPEKNSALSLATKWELDGMVELLLAKKADPRDPAVTKILGLIHSDPHGIDREKPVSEAALKIREMISEAQSPLRQALQLR